jgi:NADH:ubiquinone reductase (H+-translocating)
MSEVGEIKTSAKRVVILGGGFGGVYTALGLEKRAGSRPIEVTLVSRENYFLMTPLLFEAGSGVLEPRHAVSPLRSLFKTTRFVEAEVKGVDLDRKVVQVSPIANDQLELPFDHLVIALGGTTNTTIVPGSEHAMTFKTLGDAIFIRNHMIDLFERADVETDPQRRKQMLCFVIIGAGLVGTELVGELTEFAANIARSYHHIDPKELRFELIEAGKRIIPEMDAELSEYAAKVLRKRGVSVRADTPVKSIEANKVQLESESIESSTIVIATGVTPSPVVAQIAVEKDKRGRIITDSTMAVKDKPGIWSLGDCAAIPDPANPQGKPYPQLAQHALREARRLAKNLILAIDGQPPQPFVYSNKGMLAALGHFRGVGRVYKFRIYGFFAWWVWRTYYLLQMPRIPRRIRIMIDWTIALMFKNDIVKLDLFGEEHPLRRRS